MPPSRKSRDQTDRSWKILPPSCSPCYFNFRTIILNLNDGRASQSPGRGNPYKRMISSVMTTLECLLTLPGIELESAVIDDHGSGVWWRLRRKMGPDFTETIPTSSRLGQHARSARLRKIAITMCGGHKFHHVPFSILVVESTDDNYRYASCAESCVGNHACRKRRPNM